MRQIRKKFQFLHFLSTQENSRMHRACIGLGLETVVSILFTNDARAVCRMNEKFSILHEAAANPFTTDFNKLWHVSKHSSVCLKLNVHDSAHFDSCFVGTNKTSFEMFLQWVIKNGNSSAQI